MLDKGDIETCKQEAKNYIEFMESAGDNAAFARGLLDYINQLEKEKMQNTKLRLQTIPMLEGELKVYKDRVEELKNEYDKDTHILQNQLDKANADKIELNKRLKETMDLKINGKAEDISMILVSAERYALGRCTYIVQWTCEFIKNNLHLLSEKDRQVMIRDIENPISYGDECDKAEWLKLLKVLKEE